MPTASLAPFDKAASCFDSAIVAARDAMCAAGFRPGSELSGGLVEINDMLRLLKSSARAAIGLLAASEQAEHRVMADLCRVRMADAINLHRAASRCIKRGVAPPLPASYPVMVAPIAPVWVDPFPGSHAWLMAWGLVWTMAWSVGRS